MSTVLFPAYSNFGVRLFLNPQGPERMGISPSSPTPTEPTPTEPAPTPTTPPTPWPGYWN